MADRLTLDRKAMKDRSTAHLRIYVGNLPDNTSVEELYEHFIPFGQINGIVITKNFAFVQFEEESSAQESITKANGSAFKGRTLIVRTSQTNQSQDKRREAEVVIIQPEVPPAVALSDNIPVVEDEGGDELYDNYGNYIGDSKDYREEEYDGPQNRESSEAARGGPRGRGARGAMRGRGGRGRPMPPFNERSPGHGRGGEWPERGFDRFQKPVNNYPPRAVPVTERNDCEIIVVSKSLTEYAEYIEGRLKRLGIVVDLLFPMEDVPIGKVLGNIASRGCLYAILVVAQNQEHRSLTLTILHGLPQEHRNIPLEDALQLLSRNFQEIQRAGPTGREAVYALLGQLADGQSLTVLQYDKVIEYLQERREQQVKIELGEPLPSAPASKTQVDLQQRILSILNDKQVITKSEPVKTLPETTAPTQDSQNKLLNDPTVRKALDSILQKFV